MKKCVLLVILALTLLTVSGCSSLDELSQFERIVSTSVEMSDDLDVIESQDVTEQDINLLNTTVTIQLSSETISLTNQEKIVMIRTLYQAIGLQRLENANLFEENKISFQILKSNIVLFRESDATLAQEDRTLITDYRVAVRDSRLSVLETKGSIKELVIQVKENFDLDHLDLIITNFQEILNILELRNEHLLLVRDNIEFVNLILLPYIA